MASDSSVPISWILLFVALALGAGAVALSFVAGSAIPSVLGVSPVLQ